MPKKIMINGITLEGANIVPLLLKVKQWQSTGHDVVFFGTTVLKRQIEAIGTIEALHFILLDSSGEKRTKFGFMMQAIRRNWHACSRMRHLAHDFDVIYTISPVLDLVIFPYVLKKVNKNLRWVTVFDNTVPFILDGKIVAGNKVIRLLAWLFYQASLWFLRSADHIFVIKPELYRYFMRKGFSSSVLTVTGNGVEQERIQKAQALADYSIDALFIGRINEAKGIYDLLKVLDRVKDKYPNFQLAIMGEGDRVTVEKFKKKIADMRLGENIQFLGYRIGQEKFDLIKSSKIFLFLSETESVPIAPLEAVCSGLKTLVYDLDAYAMYENGEVLVFKKHDWEAVAQEIVRIFDTGDFDNPAGKLLLGKYSWSVISRMEMEVMEKL